PMGHADVLVGAGRSGHPVSSTGAAHAPRTRSAIGGPRGTPRKCRAVRGRGWPTPSRLAELRHATERAARHPAALGSCLNTSGVVRLVGRPSGGRGGGAGAAVTAPAEAEARDARPGLS